MQHGERKTVAYRAPAAQACNPPKMYNFKRNFLKCCVPWLRQEPLGMTAEKSNFAECLKPYGVLNKRGDDPPSSRHKRCCASSPPKKCPTTRSYVPVSLSRAARKKKICPQKAQTGSFLKTPNLSQSLLREPVFFIEGVRAHPRQTFLKFQGGARTP